MDHSLILTFVLGVLLSIFIIPVVVLFFKILKGVLFYPVFRLFNITSKFNEYKSDWTVITGCTDGIGKAYLKELLSKGLRKFILISRNPTKLANLCDEIREDYSDSELYYLAFDFSTHDYTQLTAFLQQYTVSLLVNMAGVGPTKMEKYSVLPEQDTTILTVNVMAAAKMMQILLPQMRARKKGTIVNMASSQSFAPIPLLASYSASKICMVYLSNCVRYENKDNNIRVQVLIPLLVATKMSKYKQGGCCVIASDKYASNAVHSLHLLNYTTGCCMHEIQMALLTLVPWRIIRPVAMMHYFDQRSRINALADAN